MGYTNAGKSSLLNRISGSDAYVEDKLFATLDPITRKVHGNFDFLVSDTVGFINKLPHDLISAFKSTLEQAKYADLILHVVDSSSTYAFIQMDVVKIILDELDIKDIPVIEVYNKWENSIMDDEVIPKEAVKVSAKTGFGIDKLTETIEENLFKNYRLMEVVIPYEKGNLQQIIRKGIVEAEEYRNDGIYFKAKLKKQYAQQLEKSLEE